MKKGNQTLLLVAIGGFVLYEVMKNQQANANPLGQLGTDFSNLFGGGSAGGASGSWGGSGAGGSNSYNYLMGS